MQADPGRHHIGVQGLFRSAFCCIVSCTNASKNHVDHHEQETDLRPRRDGGSVRQALLIDLTGATKPIFRYVERTNY